VVSYQTHTAETWVCTWVSPHGMCGGQSRTGTGISPSSLIFTCQYHSTMALHTHISPGGRTIGPLVTAVQRHSLTPSTRTTTTVAIFACEAQEHYLSVRTLTSLYFITFLVVRMNGSVGFYMYSEGLQNSAGACCWRPYHSSVAVTECSMSAFACEVGHRHTSKHQS